MSIQANKINLALLQSFKTITNMKLTIVNITSFNMKFIDVLKYLGTSENRCS